MRGKALKNYGTVAALVIIIGIFGLLRPASFFTLKNFLNITRQAAPLAMVALGATFVMTVNEFDLSIGNIVSLGGVVAALLSIQGVPIPVCFLAAVAAGLVVGCVNGVIVAKFGILSFITTLGMGTVLDGVIYGLTGGTTVFNGIPKAFTIPGILKIAGIPFITIVAAVLYMVFHIFMNHMSAGRKLYAIGGSEEAARVAGIRIFRYRVLAFSIPFRETAAVIPPERKGRDAMSVTEIENYRELILENIEYDCLKQRYHTFIMKISKIMPLPM